MEELQDLVFAHILKNGYNGYLDVVELLNSDCFTDERGAITWVIFDRIYGTTGPPARVKWQEFLVYANELGYKQEIRDNKEYFGKLSAISVNENDALRAAKKLRINLVKNDLVLRARLAIDNAAKLKIDASIDEVSNTFVEPILSYIDSLNIDNVQMKRLSDGAREYIYDLLGNPRDLVGLPSFCKQWNLAVGGGYRPGGIHILSARKKTGKSSCAINDIKYLCGNNFRIPILYLDREMQAEIAQVRMTANLSRTKIWDIEHGKVMPGSKNFNDIGKALTELEDMPLWYANVSSMTFDQMLLFVRRWLIRHVGYDDNGKMKPCLVIYDYFKLNSEKAVADLAEYQVLGFQATKFADLALKYNFPVSAYVQSNQEGKVSQSDRLSWLCSSLSYLVVPDPNDQVARPHLGNRKLEIDCCRFGPGLGPNDYIAMKLDGKFTQLEVLGLASEIIQETPKDTEEEKF